MFDVKIAGAIVVNRPLLAAAMILQQLGFTWPKLSNLTRTFRG
jgi:hypothetical protein